MKRIQETFMKRALHLATLGDGFVNPNPMVGAVIVKNGVVIGEGYHACHGEAHAEVVALKNAKESVKGATIYVTLEPCSHYGKTPPCAKMIVDNGFSEVVIAMLDPNPLVSGRGVAMLEEAGIKVTTGILETQALELNKVFCKYITTQTPYVLLKSAMTLDGKIATHTGNSRWVSGTVSREQVHKLRHSFMGIMVGINTVLADNPSLDCRLAENTVRQPMKIIVDSQLRTPLDAKLWDGNSSVIIATTTLVTAEKIEQYEEKGAKVLRVGENQVDLSLLMQQLGAMHIDSILLEGGATLNASALESKIVDEVWVFVAPKIVGGNKAPSFVGGKGVALMQDAFKLENLKVTPSGEDFLIKALIPK